MAARWLDDPRLPLALAAAYGWTSVALTPSEADRVVYGVAHLACGHDLRFQVSEREFIAAGPSGADPGDAIDRAVRRAVGRCYRVEPAQATGGECGARADERHGQLLHLRAMSPSPTCTCRGCAHFHLDAAPTEGQDAHHTRILLALDLSLAAACRSRGVPACNGQDEDRHAAARCDVGTLHTRAGELAIALAAMLEQRGGAGRRGRWLTRGGDHHHGTRSSALAL